MTQVPVIKLNNGVEIPQEGFGVYQIPEFEACKRAVLTALETGYRLIDTAQAYNNEAAVGAAIEESPLDRADIFITTKVWISNYGYEQTKASIKVSLEKLKTDYIDMVLLHQPFGDYYGAYHALEELYKKGTIRAIGISNFYPDRYIDLVGFNDVIPAVNQIETHVFDQRKVDRKYLAENNTKIEVWAPLAEGANGIFTNDLLVTIGNRYHKTPAQIALKFLAEEGVVIIPKSTHPARIKENFAIWDFNLTQEELTQIRALDLGKSLFMDHESPEAAKQFVQWGKN
ncbi:aldo/keto reductase [Pediococcus siamensis]|uniref:aldo/keto reductase n=1 Tax=Pediococcus siamensis TaxID=381829 RepID=UPI0039A13A90